VGTAVTAATLLILDLLWLGVVARPLYDSALGGLKRPVILWPAAGLFYLLYIGAIVMHAGRRERPMPPGAAPHWAWLRTGRTSSRTGRSSATGRRCLSSPTSPGARP